MDLSPRLPELVLDPPRPEDEIKLPAADLPEEDWDLCTHSVEGCTKHEPDTPEPVLDPPPAPPKLCDVERGCVELPIEGLAAASMLNGLGARPRPGGASTAALATTGATRDPARALAEGAAGAQPSTPPAPLTPGVTAEPTPGDQGTKVTGSGTGVPAWMLPPTSAPASTVAGQGGDQGAKVTGDLPGLLGGPVAKPTSPPAVPLGPGLVVPGAPGLQLQPGQRALPGAGRPDGTKLDLDQLLRDGQAPAGDQGGSGGTDPTMPDQVQRLFGIGQVGQPEGGGQAAPEPTPVVPEVVQPAPDDLIIPGAGAPLKDMWPGLPLPPSDGDTSAA
jgi:hypothetical protein